MVRRIIRTIAYGVFGLVSGRYGLGANTWQFWVLLAALSAVDLSHVIGNK